MISVAFDDVCSCLVAPYRWSIVGQQQFGDEHSERVQDRKHRFQ
jgi:hypothetical protein